MAQQIEPGIEVQDELWSDLVVSILSVNQYSLEKTYACLPALQSLGLCSPDKLGSWDVEDIIVWLKQAGLDRGPFMTALFAKRLSSLGVAVNAMGIADFTRSLSSKKCAEISELLMPINGIGPKVLSNFFLLRQVK
jgi:hypothetical protein